MLVLLLACTLVMSDVGKAPDGWKFNQVETSGSISVSSGSGITFSNGLHYYSCSPDRSGMTVCELGSGRDSKPSPTVIELTRTVKFGEKIELPKACGPGSRVTVTTQEK